MGPDERRLRDVLADGPMPPAQAATVIGQIAEELDSFPSGDGVHRVVTPDHVIFDATGRARLVGGPRLVSGLTGGTPIPAGMFDYLAPEVYTSNVVDSAVDVYALTCVAYHCVVGEPPYPTRGPSRAIRAHLSAPPPRPSALNPAVPFALDTVIAKGMAKDPRERFHSAGELARAARDAVIVPANAAIGRHYTYPDAGSEGGRRAISAAVATGAAIALVTARDEATFVADVFTRLPSGTELYVSREERNGYDRGAHFDAYQGLLHDDFPYVATYNIIGDATLDSTLLPADLTAYYFKYHALLTDVAHRARRLLSDLALMRPGEQVTRAEIGPGVALVIPQLPVGHQPVVHNVVPHAAYGPESFGMFLKFVVPKADSRTKAFIADLGFVPWQPGLTWYTAAQAQGRSYEVPKPD